MTRARPISLERVALIARWEERRSTGGGALIFPTNLHLINRAASKHRKRFGRAAEFRKKVQTIGASVVKSSSARPRERAFGGPARDLPKKNREPRTCAARKTLEISREGHEKRGSTARNNERRDPRPRRPEARRGTGSVFERIWQREPARPTSGPNDEKIPIQLFF